MSNKITGDEPVNPCIEVTTNGTISFSGISIRQLALKDFMCALVSGIYSSTNTVEAFKKGAIENGSETIGDFICLNASQLTEKYIEQLNK